MSDKSRGSLGARAGYAYDGLGRLVGADGRVLRSAAFARDARGNLVRRSSSRGAFSAEVSYAAAAGDRLASWSAAASGAVRADVVAVSDEPVGTGRFGRAEIAVDGEAAAGVSVAGNAVRATAALSVGRTHAVSAAVADAAGNVGVATNRVSVAVVTDAAYAWDAAGCLTNRIYSDGVPCARSAIGNRILWQGREWFPDAGLHFFRERWYDPVVGRWTSEDPIGLAGGLNLYEFCGGDPVNGRDPFGLCPVDPEDEEQGRTYWERYFDYTSRLMTSPIKVLGATPLGVMPKRWVPATGGRPPALGSNNQLTSVARGFGLGRTPLRPFLRGFTFRFASGTAGVAVIGSGVWNFGVAVGGLFGALYEDED